MVTKLVIIILYFSTLFSPLKAGETITIRGKVTGGGETNPLPFANISLSGKPIGTVSNSEGKFSLTIPAHSNDTIIVSFLGHENYYLASWAISADTFVYISLKPSVITLAEVEILPLDPLNVIEEAISKIPENYGTQPQLIRSFYRELIRENKLPYMITEAVVDIYRAATAQASHNKDPETDQVKIEKARQSIDSSLHKIPINISGGPNSLLGYDLVKSGKSFFNEKDRKDYVFRHEGYTEFNGRNVIIIGFEKQKRKKTLSGGTLYIDEASRAIVMIESVLDPSNISSRNSMELFGVYLDFNHLEITSNYSFTGNKWVLSHSKANMKFDITANRNLITRRLAPELFEEGKQVKYNYEVFLEMVITDRDHLPLQPFREDEIFRGSTFRAYQQLENTDDFWKGYNYIVGDSIFTEAIQSLFPKY